MDEFEDAAAEIVEGLGSAFVYFDHVELREIEAVFSNPWQRSEGGRGPAVSSRRPELMITRASVPGAKQGDLVFQGKLVDFEGVFDYEVASDPRDDEESTSLTLILKKAA